MASSNCVLDAVWNRQSYITLFIAFSLKHLARVGTRQQHGTNYLLSELLVSGMRDWHVYTDRLAKCFLEVLLGFRITYQPQWVSSIRHVHVPSSSIVLLVASLSGMLVDLSSARTRDLLHWGQKGQFFIDTYSRLAWHVLSCVG